MQPPEDNIESIYETASKLARTYSYGGGCGIDISKLSPRGAKVNNAAETTSGSVSFMDTYSLVTETIGQSGRRGALMISLDCHHPDLEEFIDIKLNPDKVTKANISVKITDDFMTAVKNNSDFKLSFTRDETGEVIEKVVNARDVFYKLAKNNWAMAEPGCLFWDKIQNFNLLSEYPDFEYAGVNPCLVGDTLISTVDGNIPIKDLVGKTPYVYCMGEDGCITIKQASKVWKTRENTQVVRVVTRRGYIDCTPDHKIHTQNRGWVEARDLKKGDKVTGLNRMMKDETHVAVSLSGSKYITEHRLVAGAFYDIKNKRKSFNLNYGTGRNWFVKEVIILDEKQDVYDMCVPEVHNFVANRMVVHNCAEEPLPAGGSCLLGSINLAEFIKDNGEFDFKEFRYCIKEAVIALNEVLEEGLPLHPLEEQRESVNDWKQIGLGIMGLADALIKMGIKYGSPEAISICNRIGMIMALSAIMESINLGKKYGAFPKYDIDKTKNSRFFKEHMPLEAIPSDMKLRNSQLLTIAPTGSISNLFGVSSGIEPIYATSYTRKTESLHGKDSYYKVYTPIVKQYMEDLNLSDENDLPDYFITASEIHYKDRINMQAIWQKHIDASISSTVNLPYETTIEEVFDLYVYAWEKGLKGITIYRDGCNREGILSTTKKREEKKSYSETEYPRGMIEPVPTGLAYRKYKLSTGCGKLYLFVGLDETECKIYDIFCNTDGVGGCVVNSQAVSRLISSNIRGGVPIEYIIEQLKKAGSCPSYQFAKGAGKEVSKGKSCASAIGNVLQDILNEFAEFDYLESEKDELTIEEQAVTSSADDLCPECGHPLIHKGGCIDCMECGWSRCSN